MEVGQHVKSLPHTIPTHKYTNKLCEQCDERCDEQCLYHLYESKLIPTTTWKAVEGSTSKKSALSTDVLRAAPVFQVVQEY